MFLKSSISSSRLTQRNNSFRSSFNQQHDDDQRHRGILKRRQTTTSSIHVTDEKSKSVATTRHFLLRSLSQRLHSNFIASKDYLAFTLRKQSEAVKKDPRRKRINIIVHGRIYQTFEDTLNRHPSSLLGNKTRRDKFYNKQENAFVFDDRCPRSFDAILFYYQSDGILSRPCDVPRLQFIEELEFFQITEFMDDRQQQDAQHLKEILKHRKQTLSQTCGQQTWRLLSHQNKSFFGRLWTGFHFLITVLSLVLICSKTLPHTTLSASSNCVLVTDFCFNMIYALELGGNFLFAPHLRENMSTMTGTMDVFNTISYYVFFFVYFFDVTHHVILKLFNFLLTARVFKLFKFSESARYILYTLHETRYYLQLFATAATIIFLWFAIIIYLVETSTSDVVVKETSIKSIGDGVWFVIVTCTGVGYGDIYPSTVGGKLCGSMFCLTGLLLFCLPTSVLMNKFIDFYFLVEAFREEQDRDERQRILETREDLLSGR
jgi:K+ channel tetramerisation domain./Ion transport protein.